MAREIKFKVDVDTEASVAELRKLRKEIRDVAAGSEEFKKLQQNIDDIQDSLVASRASAGNFFDILGQLPGPIGSIGSAVGSTITALKQFTLIKFSDLAGSVIELGKDFLDIGKNILNLTGITKVYTVVNETLTAAMTALGIAQTTAAAASRVLAAALTATGIGAIVVAVGYAVNAFNDLTKSLEENAKVNKELAGVQSQESVALTEQLKLATDVTANRNLQIKAIEDLKKAYPGFNAFIDKENNLTKQGVEFIKLKIKQYELEAQAKLIVGKIAENNIKVQQIENSSLLEQVGTWEKVWASIKSGGNTSILVNELLAKGVSNTRDEVKKIGEENDRWRKSLTTVYDQTNQVVGSLKPLEATLKTTADAEEAAKKVTASKGDTLKSVRKEIEDYIASVKKLNTSVEFNQLSAGEKELEAADKVYKDLLAKAKKYNIDLNLLAGKSKEELLNIAKESNVDIKSLEGKSKEELLNVVKQSAININSLTEAYQIQRKAINSKYESDLLKSISEYVKTNEDLRKDARDKELNDSKIAYDLLIKEAERLGVKTNNITESYNARVVEINKKYDDEIIKNKKEFTDKVNEINVAAIANEIERARKERETKFQNDLASLEADKNFIKLSEDEKSKLRVLLANAYNNDILKINEDARQKDNADLLKKYDDELRLLELRGQSLLAGTKAYYENRAQILYEEEQKELAALDLTEKEKTAIKEKYSKLRQQLDEDELAATGKVISQTIDALANVSNAIASSYDEEAKTSEEAFEKRKKLQKATALLSAASGLVQILTQPSVLPSPFDWIVKGINAVALGIATAVNIKKIDAVKFDGGGSAASAGSTGVSGGAASAATPNIPTPQIAQAIAPQVQTGMAQNPATQITRTLAQTTQKPVEAFVVSTSVSSQQQLDRRTNRAATL